ncbi:MAG: S-layer homology domain-containing protein [Clostridiaceae bacterium]|nr:S-layer homology domain-containing protein [Clostridiaceae bacterium]
MAEDLDDLMKIVKEEAFLAAGTDAVMVDEINTVDFDYDVSGLADNDAVEFDEATATITWNIGKITEAAKVIEFKVKPKEGKSGTLYTNTDVNLTYLPAGETTKETISRDKIGHPTVTIGAPPATTYSVTYDWKPDGLELYREDGTGPIAEPVEESKFAAGAEYTINGVYTSGTVAYTHDGEGNPADRYIFSGWTTSDSDVTISDGKFIMPNRNVTLTGTWDLDNWHDAIPNDLADKDSDQGGDGTPDKYQVLVKYESEGVNKGTVTPAYEVITLTNREVLVEKADVTVSGSTATPNPGYSFEKWTDNGGNTVTETIDDETTNVGPVLPAQTIPGAVGGTTYTYTAYWTKNVPNLSVEKTVVSVGGVEVDYTAPSVNIPTAKVGDTIVWNITVTNSGKADGSATLVDSIEGVKIYSVTDGVKTELTGNALTITVPANASVSYVAEYTVTTADKGQTLTNTITLSDGDNTTEDPSGTAGGVKVENIDVEKVLTGIYAPNSTTAKTGTTAEVGDTIKWTITVTNNGDEAVTIGTPTDVLTVGGTAVDSSLVTISTSAVDSDGKYTIPGKVEGQDASSIVFNVEYTVRAEDLNKQISNSATVNGVSDTADDTVNVGATPGLSVTKTVNKTSVTVGDKIIYTITVKNTGNVDLTNVEVKDTFAAGGTGKLTVKAGDMKIGTLAVGKEAKIELEYTTTSDDRNGLKNTAMATANGVEGKSSSVDVTVKSEPITPVGPSKPQLNYEDHYAYVVGYPDGLVHPERNITRAEVATIFFRMLLDESREYFWAQENDFSDVAETDWFNNAVSTLANAQLINGYPDGSYRPNANITRAEFATIAIRFFLDEDVEIEENNLSDVKGHWAEANINLAYALELINGYPDGTFRPDQKITRAEAMAIVNRVLKRAPEKDHLLKDMIEWPDNLNTAAWYYADVQEATNSHKFHMDKEEEYEIWTELLPVRDWVALEQEWSKANSSKNPGEVVDIKITTPEAGDNGLKLD